MPSKYWIKLYHEILDDPKMGRLSDSVWRRCIEIFLLAGELDNDGLLMPTEDIAWRIRVPVSQLEDELESLAQADILQRTEDGSWVVTHFKKRQSAVSGPERTRQFRRRQAQKNNEDQASPQPPPEPESHQNGPDPSGNETASERREAPVGGEGGRQRLLHVTNQERKCNEGVTKRYRQNADTDTDTESDSNTESESLSPESNLNYPHARETAAQAAASAKQLTAELIPLYRLTKPQAEILCQSLVEEFSLGRHPPETIKQAYQKALGNQKIKRPAQYARAILNDWAETGPPESEASHGNGNTQNGHSRQNGTTPGGYPEGRLFPQQLEQLERWRKRQQNGGNGLVS